MKKILYIICLINLISCFEYILKAGRKTESGCERNDLIFLYEHCYYVNGLAPSFDKEFSLLIGDMHKAKCKINQLNFISSNFEILCRIENYFGCIEGNQEIPGYVKEEPNSIILENNDVIIFEGFSNKFNSGLNNEKNESENSTLQITAGELFKGYCEEGEYQFMIKNSIINGDISNLKEIKFNLSLSEPDNFPSKISSCKIDPNEIKEKFNININCTLGFDEKIDCLKKFGNKQDLMIEKNPDNIEINGTNISFVGFENISTIISITAGKLQKDEDGDKTIISIVDNNIDYNLNQNISFKINYQLNEEKGTSQCYLEQGSNDITLTINKKIDEIKNLTIFDNPSINYQVPNKSLKFYEFDNKTIISVFAGELKKGKCIGNKYKFQFINSIIPIEFPEIYLYMKIPYSIAFCNKSSDYSSIDCEISDNRDKCLVEDDSIDILVDFMEPENKQIDNNNISIYFHGFANKGTLEVNEQNITNKYIDGNNFYFLMKYKKTFNENISNSLPFNMTIIEMKIAENKSDIRASCFLENEYINCSVAKDKLANGNNSDIKIKYNPNPIKLNETHSINFEKFVNITTYTIVAGKIEPCTCLNGNYQFKILNVKPSSEIPYNAYLTIKVTNNTNAACEIKKGIPPYNITCNMDSCPDHLELMNNQNESNTEIYPYTLFYNEFNDKRVISIKAGKLYKGECNKISEGKHEYKYIFTDNYIDYKGNYSISFVLLTRFNSDNGINATCQINLSGSDNTAYCSLNLTLTECPEDEDITIQQYTKIDYQSIPRHTISFSGFDNNDTTTIKTTSNSKIIKQENQFIITDNVVNDNDTINAEFNFNMTIKISGENILANCFVPKVKENEIFNITCYNQSEEYSLEKDLEIIKEPTNDNYYFYGYKNKKTLTLNAGNLIKKNINNNFRIINNEFNEVVNDFKEAKYGFNLSINNVDKINYSYCSFNTSDLIEGKKINISCTGDFDAISVLENPEPTQLNNNITLHFYNFSKMNLYTLSLGQIFKKGFIETNKYIFYFNNTNISKSLDFQKTITLPILINQDEIETLCSIEPSLKTFNMKCEFNYNLKDIFSITYKSENGYFNFFEPYSKDTIYINNDEITSYTLIPGYLVKQECENYIYKFGIKNNTLNVKTINITNGELNIKLEQINQKANCLIDNENNINCNLSIDRYNEAEINYCQNIYEDIKIQEILGNENNDYILINGNILHFYNFENLATYTIVSGEILRGKCNGNVYEFSLNDNKIYNNLSSDQEIEFNLNLNYPNLSDFKCYLPINLNKDIHFNISCSKNVENCAQTFITNKLIIDNNPANVKYGEKIIAFKEFKGESTIVNLTAGNISLYENVNNYTLKFVNSSIDYELKSDFEFNLFINFNDETQSIKCTLSKDKSDIIECQLGKIYSDNILIKVLSDPNEIYNILPGKTVIFEKFKEQQINLYTINAGYISKGSCDHLFYNFSFKNATNIRFNYKFSLEMREPNIPALCNYIENNSYINCYMNGEKNCPVENNGDISVGESEPSDIKYNINNTLRFTGFKGQNTFPYEISVENLVKIGKNISNENCMYYFGFNNFTIDIDYFYEKDILFNIIIYFNHSENNATCKLYKNNEDNQLECYFELEENYCYEDEDELMEYDIIINNNSDGKINSTNCKRELILKGFNNKQTITIFPKNIVEKYSNKKNLIFSITTQENNLQYLKNQSFNLNFTNPNSTDEYTECSALCYINEENNIKCNSSSLKSNNETDIKIASNPNHLILTNTNYTYYFSKFTNLRTYTIKTSKLRKIGIKENSYYNFNILNCKSPLIPEIKNITLNITINETEERTAECVLQNKTSYAMECFILNETYNPYDIIFHENTFKLDTSIYNPDSVFLTNFIGKRTVTIKPGNLNRGKCNILPNNTSIYNFTITENEHHYNVSKVIDFNFTLKFNRNQRNVSCSMNLSGVDDTIYCSLEGDCPDTFQILRDPGPLYYLDDYITFYLEEYAKKEIINIKMNSGGKILKNFSENNYNFIITNNSVEGGSKISEDFYFDLNITNGYTLANCLLPKDAELEFNISCTIKNNDSSFDVNDEIEILEEPFSELYYFIGYKNKKTLTLNAGNLIKNNEDYRKFYIIDNHFLGNTTEEFGENEFNINLDIKYSENIINKTICSFNMKNLNHNNDVNISCLLPENIEKIKYIFVLNNPEGILLNENTTLNYYNFNKMNLYTLILGDIIKGECDQNNYIYYFYNTSLSSNSSINIPLNIYIHINNDPHTSNCEIEPNKSLFNMKCQIDGFCPSDNYEICYDINDFYQNYNYTTIYIDNYQITTTTLKAGYLIKKSCDDNFYNFYIKNNELTGNTSLNIEGVFNIKLKEFENNATCQINRISDIIINCRVENKNNENDYCSNVNRDINVDKIIYEEFSYILINGNPLHLYIFENLSTYTIEAGDLIRGGYVENKYNFKIIDSLIYNNLSNKENISFDLMLSQPKEINASCILPTNLMINNKFNISCEFDDSTGIDSYKDEILRIKTNPNDIINKTLNFKNFTAKTTMIEVNAGNMSKLTYDQEIQTYFFIFEISLISSQINRNISFNLSLEIDTSKKQANCILDYEQLNIYCKIENIESDNININITQSPLYDMYTIPEKIIFLTNFQNKQINTLIAGKIEKDSCEDGIYSFYIRDSQLQNNFNKEFNLELKEPNQTAYCYIYTFNSINKLCDIKCSFDEKSYCEKEGKDLIVDNKEPDPLRIDDYMIVYFDNFKGQNTIEYEIKVGNLLKSDIDSEKCLYYFKFDNKPFEFPNFKEDIIFKYNMSFNNSQVTASCKLSEKNDYFEFGEIDIKTVDLNCYFPLDQETCERTDLYNYDLYIGEGINNQKIVVNSTQEMNLVGFDKKETLTLLGNNIIDKYQENNKTYFIIAFKSSKEISDNTIFNFIFSKNDDNNIYKSNCSFNIESQNIICEDIDNKLTFDDDIIINSTPKYITLNNQTLYFLNFENKRTYTIKAGLIEKSQCTEDYYYKFNLIKTSSKYIPNEADFEISVLINDSMNVKTICTVKNSDNYNMTCIINDNICPSNIILNNDGIEPNEELFYPNTTFFNDFNNKRTITIKPGKIQKGKCDNSSSNYNFFFVQNNFDFNIDSVINFNLITYLNSQQYTSSCSINLENEENIINCLINTCPRTEYDLLIASNPDPDYETLYPNSIFFEDFINKNTTTIIMSKSGMIIKQENGFILTNNYINENDIIYNQFEISIKVKISEEEKEATCIIPSIKDNKTFNISCSISSYSVEMEIVILEEPENDNFYFYGYKNKRTLTLKAGSLYKEENNNQFYIKNSTFTGEYPLIEKFEFNLSTKYNNDLENNSLCFFKTTEGIIDSKIQINCTTKISEIEIQTISLLSNPNYMLLNDNITLYFTNFQNLNLYTLIPGNIIKGQCDSNSFTFNLINSSLSNSLSQSIYLNIPVRINDQNKNESTCLIPINSNYFNMSCKINNYCPNGINIDLKIEVSQKSNMTIISPDTLYIKISREKQTSTLNVGYLQKINCSEGNYFFSINDNFFTGKNLVDVNSEFELKLTQFDEIANCELNSENLILCMIDFGDDNEYCTNINKDIKIEKLNNDNNYIMIGSDNNILHFYGLENLETFTIIGGELNQGSYNNKIYSFYLNNSFAYNKISTTNYVFSLLLNKPIKVNANCSLPLSISKEEYFDINCLIYGDINDYIIQIGNEEPKDIKYNTQVINFKKFVNKYTLVTIKAGDLKLKIRSNYQYDLNFANSSIDYSLTSDISFIIPIRLNDIQTNAICHFYKDKTDIICEFDNTEKTYIRHIIILKEPNNNTDIIKGKTTIYKTFVNKEINSFTAGPIEKGSCDTDGNYTFYFRNCSSENNYINYKFYIQLSHPNTISYCSIIRNEIISSLYDVKCTLKGENACSNETEIDFTVDSQEPEAHIINNTNILYYFNFSRQSTIDKTIKYYLEGGILSKKSVEKNGDNVKYTFNIEDCSLDRPFNSNYDFNIKINLDIYDDYLNKNSKLNATCTIPKNINGTNIIIGCSFNLNDLSYYTTEGNYDIIITEGDQRIDINNDSILFISNLNDLTTVTIYGCQISKGQCGDNNKYTYTFSYCTIPKDISIDSSFEFTLKEKNGQNSKCKLNSTQIECEIEEYAVCENNNDIVIGNNEAVINYTKYSSYKNLYIIGLKNLYTTTLNGGTIDLGICQLNNFVFYFNNTKLTNKITEDLNYNLSIIQPLKTIASCTIEKEKENFDLKCIIKGENECPINDSTKLKIEEITKEKYSDLIKPNALYINNFINTNVINLNAGSISKGQCNDNIYEFYFIDSYLTGDLKGGFTKDVNFTLNLKYPDTLKAYCILPKNTINNTNFDLKCYIEGNNKCPMFYYTYIEIEENDPSIDKNIISPNILNYKGFKSQKITFEHYYLEIQNITWECIEDSYNFNLSTKFLVNVTQNENFNINITDNSNQKLLYNCNFSSENKSGKLGSIYCSINEKTLLQNINLTLNFEIINLTERNIYIINNSSNKTFTNNNVECPYFYFQNESSIPSSINTTDKSMSFSLKIETSLNNQEIKVYDSKNKTKDKLALKLKSSTTSKYLYRFLYLSAETGFDSECIVPNNTKISSQINCTGYNITDTQSESFVTESSDQIYIDKYKFDINSITVNNSYKKDDSGNNNDDNKKESSNSISTAGKVVLIIFIILVFVAIILALLYYFCFYRKQNRESQTGSSIKSESKNNQSIHSNVSQNKSVDQSNSSQRNDNSKSSRKRVVNPNEPTFEYD